MPKITTKKPAAKAAPATPRNATKKATASPALAASGGSACHPRPKKSRRLKASGVQLDMLGPRQLDFLGGFAEFAQ